MTLFERQSTIRALAWQAPLPDLSQMRSMESLLILSGTGVDIFFGHFLAHLVFPFMHTQYWHELSVYFPTKGNWSCCIDVRRRLFL